MKKVILVLALLSVCSAYAVEKEFKVYCAAKSFYGDTVTEAIQNCDKFTNYNEAFCARHVSCMKYFTHCAAKGYAGDNVKQAAARCNQLGNIRESVCFRYVSCR